MAVKQDVRTALALAGLVVAHNHRVADGGDDTRIEADVAELPGAPIRRLLAVRGIGGVGRDAGNADQVEKALHGRFARLVEALKDLGQLSLVRRGRHAVWCLPDAGGLLAAENVQLEALRQRARKRPQVRRSIPRFGTFLFAAR